MPVVTRAQTGNKPGKATNVRGNETGALRVLDLALYKKLKPPGTAKGWYTKNGGEWPLNCTVKNCRNKADDAEARDGAHVILEGKPLEIYILPTCKPCNKSREVLEYIGKPMKLCEVTEADIATLARIVAAKDDDVLKAIAAAKEKARVKRERRAAVKAAAKAAAEAAAADTETESEAPPPLAAPAPRELCGKPRTRGKKTCKKYKDTCPHHNKK